MKEMQDTEQEEIRKERARNTKPKEVAKATKGDYVSIIFGLAIMIFGVIGRVE